MTLWPGYSSWPKVYLLRRCHVLCEDRMSVGWNDEAPRWIHRNGWKKYTLLASTILMWKRRYSEAGTNYWKVMCISNQLQEYQRDKFLISLGLMSKESMELLVITSRGCLGGLWNEIIPSNFLRVSRSLSLHVEKGLLHFIPLSRQHQHNMWERHQSLDQDPLQSISSYVQ